MLSLLAVVSATFLSCHWAVGAHKYTVEFKQDYILEPCDLDGFTDIETVFDFSDLKFTRNDNDSIVMSGSFKFRKDVGVLEMSLEGKKFERGNWMPFITVNRLDYCKFITSPEDGAQYVFKSLEPKRCPFDTDTVYTLQPTAIDMEYETAYPHAHGEILILVKLVNKNKDISTCVKIVCYIH